MGNEVVLEHPHPESGEGILERLEAMKPEGMIWKLVAIILLSSAITGISSWVLFGLSRVSKADMVEYTKDQIKMSVLLSQPEIIKMDMKLDLVLNEIKKLEKHQEELQNRLLKVETHVKSN